MSELAHVLRHLLPVEDPAALVDASAGDDAAVYLLDEGRALVVTVDFFTPIVADPATFGRIGAANALSDLYAMGAKPLFALNLVELTVQEPAPQCLTAQALRRPVLRQTKALSAIAAITGRLMITKADEDTLTVCSTGTRDQAHIRVPQVPTEHGWRLVARLHQDSHIQIPQIPAPLG